MCLRECISINEQTKFQQNRNYPHVSLAFTLGSTVKRKLKVNDETGRLSETVPTVTLKVRHFLFSGA